MLTHGIPPEFPGGVHIFLPAPHTIGSVPSLSSHAIAYRLRSLPRVRWDRASSPQGSSSNGCCLCITMHQMLLCSSLFPHPLLVYSEYVQIIRCIVYKYKNISTAVVYCCTVCGTVFPPRRIEFSVHGTISSYVVFQNIVIIAVLNLFPPPNFCLYMCKGLEFRVMLEAFYGNDHRKRKHIHH